VGIDLLREWEEKDEPRTISEPYALVLHHPDTITHESVYPLISAVLETCGSMKVVWVNSNVDAGGKEMMKQVHKYSVDFVKNLPNEKYFNLLKHASVRVGNSSSFIKECAYLGRPAVIVGSRQQGREMGDNAYWVTNDTELIKQAIYDTMDMVCERDYRFGDGHACERIMEVLDAVGE
jgi:UDP-N-acetylglucosamine 2-epimerase